jgi:hypothetical protein
MFVFDSTNFDLAIANEGATLENVKAQYSAVIETTDIEFRKLTDALTLDWGTQSGVTKADYWGKPSGEVRTAVKAIVAKGEALGAWGSDMSETLVHCVGVAFQANIPFNRNLKATHDAKGAPRPAKKAAAGGAAKAGAVSTTDAESTEKTARKLIGQLRLMKRDDLAAEMVDVMLKFNPEFTETETAKA